MIITLPNGSGISAEEILTVAVAEGGGPNVCVRLRDGTTMVLPCTTLIGAAHARDQIIADINHELAKR